MEETSPDRWRRWRRLIAYEGIGRALNISCLVVFILAVLPGFSGDVGIFLSVQLPLFGILLILGAVTLLYWRWAFRKVGV